MKKIVFQGAIITLAFFVTWFALAQIDWIKVFKVQRVTDKTEQKLGEVFLEFFKKSEKEIENPFVMNAVDSIVNHVCEANKIEREYLKVHILNTNQVNAFALPNGHLIINSGLILNADNQEELTGVLCHEIAHIEHNHVMKKLLNEIGLSVLVSMTTGGAGAEVIKESAKMLSSTAFDRRLEKEADLKAVDYLAKAKVDPEPFANFLYKLSGKEGEGAKYLTWISTHPPTKERAHYIIEYNSNKPANYQTILSNDTWENLKQELQD